MTPADWQRVKAVALEAWALPETERAAYIARVCRAEDGLRNEVLALIDSMSAAGDRFEVPPAVPDTLTGSLTGHRLGAYDVLARIGTGGMGEVYRARDSRLHRTVAIKVLPPLATGDPVSRERMIREARAIAALNHPHICTIHDVGSHDGRDFLVMEFVEGETLAARLSRGRLPLAEAVRFATQIGSALREAHRAGIIHRDVKPANIVLAQTAAHADAPTIAKLLDFGIAKTSVADDDVARVTASGEPSPKSLTLTAAGTVVGTAPYMAPEQIHTNVADVRTDIFAFGAVLFEMLAGRRAFEGSDRSAVLDAVENVNVPRPSTLAPGISSGLDRIVLKSVAKNPARRYQSMDELMADLQGARRRLTRTRDWRILAAAAALVPIVAAGVAWSLNRGRDEPAAAAPVITRLTASAGVLGAPAISPDGSAVAFSWAGEGVDNPELVLLPAGSTTRRRLTNDRGVEEWPAWSPDGREVAFIRCLADACGLYALPVDGGAERKLRDLRADRYFGLAWSPDGESIVFGDRPTLTEPWSLLQLRLKDGTIRRLTSPSGAGDFRFAFSPDGRSLGIIRHGPDGISVHVVSVADGADTVLLRQQNEWFGGIAWSGDGKRLILSANQQGVRRLWQLPVAGGGLERIAIAGEDAYYPSVAAGGSRLAFVRDFHDWDFIRMTLERGALRDVSPFPSSPRLDLDPAFSPDGRRLAFVSERSGTREIWVSNADGTNAARLTSLNGPFAGRPSWSPDGKHLAFHGGGIYVMDAGSGIARKLSDDGEMPTWSADGRSIFFARTGFSIWKAPVSGGPAVMSVPSQAYAAHDTLETGDLFFGTPEGLRRRSPSGTDALLIPDLTWSMPAYWSMLPDGIYYVAREPLPDGTFVHHFRFFDFATRRSAELGKLSGTLDHWVGGLTISPDRRTVVYSQRTYQSSEIVLVEAFR